MYDIYCPFCGLPSYNDDITYIIKDKEVPPLYQKDYTLQQLLNNSDKLSFISNKKNNNWLNKCSLLLNNGKVYHNLKNINLLNKFKIKDKYIDKYIDDIYPNVLGTSFAIFLHTDCYKYIEKKLKYEITFKHIAYLNMNDKSLFKNILYPTSLYNQQTFDFIGLSLNNKDYIISPIKNGINNKFIDKVINKTKIKDFIKNEKRPSPSYPASLVPNNYYGLGNNKKIWKKEKSKWKQQPTTITKSLNNKKYISNFELITSNKKNNKDFIYFIDNKDNLYQLA